MYTHSRTVPVSSMFILKLKPYKLYANRSFRQRVTSPTTSSPTYEVDSPKSKLCQFANTGPLLPLHAYQLFLVLLSTNGPNKPLNTCTQNLNSFPLLRKVDRTLKVNIINPQNREQIPGNYSIYDSNARCEISMEYSIDGTEKL